MDAIYSFELSKQYEKKFALQNLSLRIGEGQRFSIVGSAGCGKTTALRLFAALTIPTIGECSVFGHSSQYEPEKVHSLTGVVTETSKLYESMTVRDNLIFFSGLYDLDSNDFLDRFSFLLHRLDIWETRDRYVRELSTTALQRVHLARALMHSPRILMMDEPTEGMDLDTIAVVKGLIDHISMEEGVTVLVCTRHFLHAQEFCDRYAIMDAGVIAASGDLETLRNRAGLLYRAKFILADNSPKPGAEFTREDGNIWSRKIQSETEMPELISKVSSTGCQLYQAIIEKPNLNDIYNRLYRINGTEGSAFFEIQQQQESLGEHIKAPAENGGDEPAAGDAAEPKPTPESIEPSDEPEAETAGSPETD